MADRRERSRVLPAIRRAEFHATRHRSAAGASQPASGTPSPAALRQLRDGVELDDGITQPARVSVVQEHGDGSALSITIHEGRKRQVRRMCDAVGHHVMRLVRVRIGLRRWTRRAPAKGRSAGDGPPAALGPADVART